MRYDLGPLLSSTMPGIQEDLEGIGLSQIWTLLVGPHNLETSCFCPVLVFFVSFVPLSSNQGVSNLSEYEGVNPLIALQESLL